VLRDEDIADASLVVSTDLGRREEVLAMWPALEAGPFAYTVPNGGRQMLRGVRITPPDGP
jgi:hypothetical protein